MFYEKWFGAGLGFMVTGSPAGALMGYGAGKLLEQNDAQSKSTLTTSDFEVNVLLLASEIIRAEKGVTFKELDFIRNFWKAQFGDENLEEKTNILHHFLQKKYDAKKACIDLHRVCTTNTIHQIMHFLFDLAACDKPVSEKERKQIFVLGCWMNVNDVTFLKIEADRLKPDTSHYSILGVKETDTIEKIRTHYRKLILQFHPDKNQHLEELERKKLEVKVLQIREAYEKIKKEKQ